MKVSTFKALIEAKAAARGLAVRKIEIEEDDLGGGLANVSVYVEKSDAVFPAMREMEAVLSRQMGESVRAGYYDAAGGYSDIPSDQAMMQFDCLFLDFAD